MVKTKSTAVQLKIQVFSNAALNLRVQDSQGFKGSFRIASTWRWKHYLLQPEDESTINIWNISNYLPIDTA